MKIQLKTCTILCKLQRIQKYNNKYFKKFKTYPNEITILAYDALGLIYYAWKKMEKLNQ